jgi:hypothetical protein
MVLKGERISNLTNIISVIATRKLLKKGCTTYLAYMINLENGKIGLFDVSIEGISGCTLGRTTGTTPKKRS